MVQQPDFTPTRNEAGAPTEDVDEFAQLQAILAGLPMHAVPPPAFSRSCGLPAGGCGGQRRPPPLVDGNACKQRICTALAQACIDYPDKDALAQLDVEHASLDLVCFVNHAEGTMFTAVRGTDRMLNPLTTPRDVQNDLQIAVGMTPIRTFKARDEYLEVKSRYPNYISYATGHSLGGNIVEHLAIDVEDKTDFRFKRVDVFNTGASPLRGAPTRLQSTELHAHRVLGDWASMYHTPAGGRLHVHKPKHVFRSRHVLGHFLPDRSSGNEENPDCDDEGADEVESVEFVPIRQPPPRTEPFWMSLLSCAGCRKPKPITNEEHPRNVWLSNVNNDFDCWRNFEPLHHKPAGPPPKELEELHFPDAVHIEREPFLQPVARSEEEEDDSSLPYSRAKLATLKARFADALDRALFSGELLTVILHLRGDESSRLATSNGLRDRLAVALDSCLNSGELGKVLENARQEQRGVSFQFDAEQESQT